MKQLSGTSEIRTHQRNLMELLQMTGQLRRDVKAARRSENCAQAGFKLDMTRARDTLAMMF